MATKTLIRAARHSVLLPVVLTVASAAVTVVLVRRRRARGGSTSGAVGQSSFDHAQPLSPPPSPGIGETRSDRELFEQVSAPDGYGPAPGGYGPASAPAGAHGGSGIFGAEGAGGGPGNHAEDDAEREPTREP